MRLLAALVALLLAGAGTISEGPLRFRYWPGGEPLARHIADLARGYSRLPGLPARILYEGPPIEIDLAPDPARWDSLTGGHLPDWSAGVAAPDEGRIVLPAFGGRARPSDLGEILRHELAHVALHRYLARAFVPRWFDEGYATWASGGMDERSAWMLRLAFLLHRAPPLDSLELEWPTEANQARVAYLLAASAVALLGERTGERGLQLLFLRWKETGTLDLALRRAFGITLGQFEREWRDEVRRRYGWALLLSDTLVFWLLMTPVLLVLVLVRRRRDRERLARLRETEPPDTPAYWLGVPPDSVGEGPPAAPPASPPPVQPDGEGAPPDSPDSSPP